MNKGNHTALQRFIHYGTIIGIFALIIPATFNDAFFYLIFLLMGVNLFNSFVRMVKGKWMVVGLVAVSVLPLGLYVLISGMN